MQPVAVLMAVYDGDREPWVAEAVQSILAQRLPCDLHVFLDGVTRRPLRELVESFAMKHPSVHLHGAPGNRGLAFALNDLLSAVRGRYKYLARMDADDIAEPDRLALQVAFLEAQPEVDVVGSAIREVDAAGRELMVVRYPETHESMLRFFRKRNPLAHVTVLFRESWFAKAGPYPALRREDTLYWALGFRAGCRFANLPDPLVRVRRTDEMLRRRTGWKPAWEEFRIRAQVCRMLGFGVPGYVYALGFMGVRLLPVPAKRVLYHWLR